MRRHGTSEVGRTFGSFRLFQPPRHSLLARRVELSRHREVLLAPSAGVRVARSLRRRYGEKRARTQAPPKRVLANSDILCLGSGSANCSGPKTIPTPHGDARPMTCSERMQSGS